MTKAGLLASLAALLASCASAPATRAPTSPSRFEVAQDYEGAYRKVLESARRCWPATAAAGQGDVQGTLDNDAKRGRIALAFRSRHGADTRLVVELAARDREHTDVRVSGPSDIAQPAGAIRGWLEGTSVDCP